MTMQNKKITRSFLRAEWRFLTQEQIEALPKSWSECKNSDELYYYPGKQCGDHIALRAKTSKACVYCRDRKRALKPEASEIIRQKLMKLEPKRFSAFGMSLAVNRAGANNG